MSTKSRSTINYDKNMLEKQKKHRKNQAVNENTIDFSSKITRSLDSFKFDEPIVKVVSKKKSNDDVLGGSYLKYTQKPFQQNVNNKNSN